MKNFFDCISLKFITKIDSKNNKQLMTNLRSIKIEHGKAH